ncbi:MAG: hypothetical protein EPO07_12220 [Verrucomicrobia bacterium]|nr:MAG: hypothetical protein EPO07_12220 [Verrucomicrobiota bacterium]
MIWLADDCLLFELANGESVPFSAEMISIELIGDTGGRLDPEVVSHASASVFHYFKHELHRDKVSVGEFTLALERVLRGLGFRVHSAGEGIEENNQKVHGDLRLIAHESGDAGELVFYPRLRDAFRGQLARSPRIVRFHGLRGCVKQLTRSRRWSTRCESLREQIVEYLRGCLSAESSQAGCSLVVE